VFTAITSRTFSALTSASGSIWLQLPCDEIEPEDQAVQEQ
jgi:hypothetical protein